MGLLQNLGLVCLYITSSFAQPNFTSFDIQPGPLIEWDQQPYSFYTGQTLNTTWTSEGFLPSDAARITYVGAGGTRTLTTGTPIINQNFAIRISDSTNGLATNVPLTIALSTNAAVSLRSNQTITILQSKLMNIQAFDGNRTLGGGQNTVCDDRNITVSWRGLGESQFGIASVSLSKVSGTPGTLGTSLSNFPVSGNMTINFLCPRSATPSTFSAYAFQISVQEPGGSAYTGSSPSFTVVVAPTPTPTPSTTPTSSRTPTPTPSITPTPSETPTNTPTPTSSPTSTPSPTPSITPTQSPTPSTTPSANPSVDIAGIAKAAAASVDTTTPAIAGVFGGIGGILLLFGILRWHQRKKMTELRLKKLAMTNRFVREANEMYHTKHQETSEPSVVMYTVAGYQPKQMDVYKKAFPPKATK